MVEQKMMMRGTRQNKDPYKMIFKAIVMAPKFNADKAWQEVKEERKRERS